MFRRITSNHHFRSLDFQSRPENNSKGLWDFFRSRTVVLLLKNVKVQQNLREPSSTDRSSMNQNTADPVLKQTSLFKVHMFSELFETVRVQKQVRFGPLRGNGLSARSPRAHSDSAA